MWRLIVVLALAATLAACGEDEDGGGGGGDEQAKTLKVYSSLPLQGAAREQNVAIVNGAKLALEQAGGRAGKFAIEYESLDDSTAQAAGWEPGATTANAVERLRMTRRSPTSASSTPVRRRCRCHCSTRPDSFRSAPATRPSASPPTRRGPRQASRTSTTRPASAPTPAYCPRTPCRAPRWSRS